MAELFQQASIEVALARIPQNEGKLQTIVNEHNPVAGQVIADKGITMSPDFFTIFKDNLDTSNGDLFAQDEKVKTHPNGAGYQRMAGNGVTS